MVLQPIDGGAGFYTRHGYTKAAPLDNPAFFTVGIWYPSLNGTSDVTAYQDLDINMLDRPTGSCDLSLLAGTGIYAIPQYGECGGPDGSGIGNETVGLFTDDEVDGNYGPGAGYTYLQSIIDGVPAGLKVGRLFLDELQLQPFPVGDADSGGPVHQRLPADSQRGSVLVHRQPHRRTHEPGLLRPILRRPLYDGPGPAGLQLRSDDRHHQVVGESRRVGTDLGLRGGRLPLHRS